LQSKDREMSFTLSVASAVGVLIAYANGSNDVSKGIATLVGTGVTDYRRAILWGTVWTGLGGLAGSLLAGAMIGTFGKGFLASGIAPTLPAAIATILGAAVWVGFATRAGLPVSTTHAIVGSVIGVGATAYGFSGVSWAVVGTKIALPLLLSPIVALVTTALVLRTWKYFAVPVGNTAECLCTELEPSSAAIAVAPDGILAPVLANLPAYD
jgi:inorganic phosphate transporter, PiT family